METLEYNDFGGEVPRVSAHINYGANSGGFQQNYGTIPDSIEAHGFYPNSLNYTYYPADSRTGLSPALPASDSPRSSQNLQLPTTFRGSASDADPDGRSTRGSSTEERDGVSLAQVRRKEQNRAAQRAFRERKDRHVRDLEAKLEHLAKHISLLQSENERLKSMLQRVQLENEKLRTASTPAIKQPFGLVERSNVLQPAFPAQITPAPVQQRPITSNNTTTTHASATNIPGSDEVVLSATDVWQLLQTHPLYLSGTLDIGKVCEHLRRDAQLNSNTPVLSRNRVYDAIVEVSRACGTAIGGSQL